MAVVLPQNQFYSISPNEINVVKICMLQTKTTEGILLIDNNMEVLRLFNPQRESVFRLAFPGYFH